jgi:hypothetical protein
MTGRVLVVDDTLFVRFKLKGLLETVALSRNNRSGYYCSSRRLF